MADAKPQNQPATPKVQLFTPDEKKQNVIGLLLIGCVVLVCFSTDLGRILVSQGWVGTEVHEVALNIRFLSAMLFVAGLAELYYLRVKGLKDSDKE